MNVVILLRVGVIGIVCIIFGNPNKGISINAAIELILQKLFFSIRLPVKRHMCIAEVSV